MLVGTICRICGKTRRDLINRYVTNDVAVGNVCVEFLGGLPTTFSYGKALSGGSSPYAYPNTYQLLPAAHDRNRTVSWHAKDKKLNRPIIPKKKKSQCRQKNAFYLICGKCNPLHYISVTGISAQFFPHFPRIWLLPYRFTVYQFFDLSKRSNIPSAHYKCEKGIPLVAERVIRSIPPGVLAAKNSFCLTTNLLLSVRPFPESRIWLKMG